MKLLIFCTFLVTSCLGKLYTFHPTDNVMHFERLKRQTPVLAPVTSDPLTPPPPFTSELSPGFGMVNLNAGPRPPPQVFNNDKWVPNVRNDDGSPNSDGIQTRFEDADKGWATATNVTVNHDYYQEAHISNLSPAEFAHYWHELHTSSPLGTHYDNEHSVHEFKITDGIPQAHISEPHELKDSYRRAVNVPISFKFPFYGVVTRNVTIATGGFCYIGENSHSWLAATQYIAPLMANFATDDANATILYEETKERMVIQWHDVMLKDKRDARFTFQTSLWANGSIWFAYKNVGAPVSQVSDFHHPRKVGLSDAYLESPDANTGSKRIIHEYHRIEIDFAKITNLTVIILDPKETCLTQTTCDACNSVQLASWNCTWCEASDTLTFCSDDDGKHRMNEQFHSKCADTKEMNYCSNGTSTVTDTPVDGETTTTEKSTEERTTPAGDAAHKAGVVDKKVSPGPTTSGSSSTMFFVILAVMAISLAGWLGYAYMNPQSRSGQCLIRYRPSRWHMPNSDVRYTASVHM